MTFDPQLLAVVALVALAGVYLARRMLKEWSGSGKPGCGGGCGCAGKPVTRTDAEKERIPLQQIKS